MNKLEKKEMKKEELTLKELTQLINLYTKLQREADEVLKKISFAQFHFERKEI